MELAEHKDGLRFDGRMTRLVFPYGLLINGDGNAIYTVFLTFKNYKTLALSLTNIYTGGDPYVLGSDTTRKTDNLNVHADLRVCRVLYPALPLCRSLPEAGVDNSDVQRNRH